VSSRMTKLLPAGMAAMLLLAACGGGDSGAASSDGAAADATPALEGERIRFIVPTSPGGGFDTTARQLQPYLEDQLGATLTVENLVGARTAVGMQAAISAAQDCTTIVLQGIPHMQFSYLGQEVNYDGGDFVPVGGVSGEFSVIRVQNDAPWQTIEELIEYAQENPGELTFSVSSPTSNNNLALLRIEEAVDADFNVVAYDGGGPARTGLVAGEVDATHAGVFNSLSIDDATRVLAVHADENGWPELTDDAPTLNEALGTDLAQSSSNYGVLVPAGCEADHPERYQALVDGLQGALEDPEYQSTLEELGELEKLDPLSPEEYEQLSQETEDDIAGVLENNPDVFAE
jgi:putative tricarboxylic transport membrane protein